MKKLEVINSIRHGRYLFNESMELVIGQAVGIVEKYDVENRDFILKDYYTDELTKIVSKYFRWLWVDYIIWDKDHQKVVGLIIRGNFELN